MSTQPLPPKPQARPGAVSLWRYARLFRADILSAQPERLYRAWMADFRTPFFRSVMCNDPDLWRLVLNGRPGDFPKSERVREGLRPLLGQSVFLTNGAAWARQRRLIDPAFEGGRLRHSLPAMQAAAHAMVARLSQGADPVEVEEVTAHTAADVIFRTLFSLPIEDRAAAEVFAAFRAYQRTQPLLTPGALLPVPRWLRRRPRRAVAENATLIRARIAALCDARAREIAQGTAPDDLATKIMTASDPDTGRGFETAEMVDQVAIFFLAGHETSASALSWALYLLATHPEAQARAATEATALPADFGMADLPCLAFTRDVLREALRLYPPVPMMVRSSTRREVFRGRQLARGTQVVLSPWHLHRHGRLWNAPDAFLPDRWQTQAGRRSARKAYIPFSSGPRVCPGAGFAMLEGVVLLSALLRAFRLEPVPDRVPVPVAHLTVRARDGIWLRLVPRVDGAAPR